MEYRQLGGSGLYVPALCLGTATFGGTNGFEGWGHTEVEEATRMVNLCLDAGVNLFDTADPTVFPRKSWERRSTD